MTRPASNPPPPPAGPDAALRRIREHGGRVTAARRTLIEILYDDQPPLTADDLASRMGDHDRSVIYRNLAQLEELGIAEHVHLGHGQASYRAAGQPTIPVVCETCGTTRDLDRTHARTFTRRVAELTGIHLDLTHLPLTGVCGDCTDVDRGG